jgi:Flp pilus assembly protein TadD
LQKAIQERPTLEGAYRDLSKLYMETNDYPHAQELLVKLIRIDPTEPNFHFLLSSTYRHMGKKPEADAEMAQFQTLDRAQTERRRPSDAILAGAGGEKADSHPADNPDAQ